MLLLLLVVLDEDVVCRFMTKATCILFQTNTYLVVTVRTNFFLSQAFYVVGHKCSTVFPNYTGSGVFQFKCFISIRIASM